MRFVFFCILDQGHFVVSTAIAKSLLYRNPNNEIYFVTDQEYAGFVKAKCSRFQALVYHNDEQAKNKHQVLISNLYKSWEEKATASWSGANACKRVEKMRTKQDEIRKLIQQVSPDLVFIDSLFSFPFIMSLPLKWVQIVSVNMLKIGNHIDFPPIGSGQIENFESFAKDWIEQTNGLRLRLNQWFEEFGLVRKPAFNVYQPSPYFNVFLYPKPLNYFEPEADAKWVQLSSTMLLPKVNSFIEKHGWTGETDAVGKEILTEEFLARPGQLVLLSLGTILSTSVELLRDQVLPAIAGSPNKFVVSKGLNGDHFELPANCVGANNLKQLEFLDGLVELFITHGGNNYGDQADNACRVETCNLGKRLDLTNLTASNLQSAIDFVLKNETIKKNLKELSEIVQKDDTMERLCDLIVQTCASKSSMN